MRGGRSKEKCGIASSRRWPLEARQGRDIVAHSVSGNAARAQAKRRQGRHRSSALRRRPCFCRSAGAWVAPLTCFGLVEAARADIEEKTLSMSQVRNLVQRWTGVTLKTMYRAGSPANRVWETVMRSTGEPQHPGYYAVRQGLSGLS